MVGENFQIYDVQVTKKCISESKNWMYTFLFMTPRQNSSPGSDRHPIEVGNYLNIIIT